MCRRSDRSEESPAPETGAGIGAGAGAGAGILVHGTDGEPLGIRGAVERLRSAQRAPDDRTAGILLWYSMSAVLARSGGHAVEVTIGDHGFVESVTTAVPTGPTGDTAAATTPPVTPPVTPPGTAERIGAQFRDLIPRIAAASGARERSLWAIATDSIAGAALSGAAPAGAALSGTVESLLAACGPDAPPARFETVPGRGTVVRRGSCCLLYLCAAGTKCLSCPRQLPADRRRRLGGGA